jgi:hypothetical protein
MHTPVLAGFHLEQYTDKKENKMFLIYKEIQGGAVANNI